MSSNKPKGIAVANPGFLKELILRIRLVLRLMGDHRVNPFFKLIPVATIVYLIVPFDIPGPVDDAAVLWLGNSLFVELCPPGVVQEHLDQLKQIPSVNYNGTADPGEVVDAEFRETKNP
jgi:hypothetical protein